MLFDLPCGDCVGINFFLLLSNGNYVVNSPLWNGSRGAETWADGTTGIHGVVSEANSLVGSSVGDLVGSHFAALSNGNYLLGSPSWNGNRGAVTWGDGNMGVRGIVSEANSLVGNDPNDRVGVNLSLLSNGNYVLGSPSWNGNRGAATWGSGTTGVRGTISEANSLVGSSPDDQVGINLAGTSSGNYLVGSRFWNGHRGAVTWGDGTTGIRGTISADNSLVGSNPNDQVGFTATPLS